MTPEELTQRIQKATPFIQLLGIEITRADGDGEVEMIMPIKPEFTQNLGHAHGGAVGTLADFACNLAIKDPTVTVEYKINFFAPAAGQSLRAVATTIKSGRKVAVAQADVYAVDNGEEKHVATCLATLIPSPKK